MAQTSALDPADAVPPQVTRTWLAPHFWVNRLQDWRLNDGRIECLTGAAGDEVRTVAWLTREMIVGHEPTHLRVRAGLIEDVGGGGFCGFLIGAGTGCSDYRTATADPARLDTLRFKEPLEVVIAMKRRDPSALPELCSLTARTR